MTSTITAPFWLFALLAALAGFWVLDRMLIPSVRWALRRRANRAVEKLNQSLKLRIQPFKMTRRQVLIDRLMYDPDVMAEVDIQSRETGAPRAALMSRVRSYAREIVPAFSAYTYFGFGARWARRLSQMLYRVRLGFSNEAALARVAPDASVVFVINHRSNLDYLLVTYMAASSSALSYAVGEWARIWPLQSLIRAMGAFFIRRQSGDRLYRKVLSRYVVNATQAGVVQAVFPEGGLSLDGKLRPPKLGLINYIVAGFDPAGARDVVFIPVGVNYDRVLEDRILTEAGATRNRQDGEGAAPRKLKFRISFWKALGFLFHSLWLRLRGRWHRYGYACVSFGEPLSLRDWIAAQPRHFYALSPEERPAEIERLGQRLMQRVGEAVPALPVALVATALLEAGDHAPTEFELNARVHDLMTRLEERGAYIHIPRHDRGYAIDVGLRMLVMRHLALREGETLRANPKELMLLGYYANSIAHLFEPGAAERAAVDRPGRAAAG